MFRQLYKKINLPENVFIRIQFIRMNMAREKDLLKYLFTQQELFK